MNLPHPGNSQSGQTPSTQGQKAPAKKADTTPDSTLKAQSLSMVTLHAREIELGHGVAKVNLVFRIINSIIILCSLLVLCYFLFASDRYVSEATVIIQNTEQIGMPSVDVSSIIGMGTGASMSRPDQMLLREHLLSVDMLKKLDAALDLRSHYSDTSHDIASRMWFRDISMEWFHRHFLGRVKVEFDDFSGVLHITTQAYNAKMAYAITAMLVQEGEKYMNEMSQELARTQVRFLDAQVKNAYEQMQKASAELVSFQNTKGLASPKDTLERMGELIAKLEEQRISLQTQLAALPKNIAPNNPTRKSLVQSLAAVEKQLEREKNTLASSRGKTLNSLVEEEARLQLDLEFKQEVYKSALTALETGRMNASKLLRQVSILQKPTIPEYAWEPRRIYGTFSTVIFAFLVLGVVRLLKSVVLDHVD